MAGRVDVIRHEQVVFLFRHFLREVQVSTLESRLKDEGFVLGIPQLVHLTVEDVLLCLVNSITLDTSGTQTRILGLLSEVLTLVNEHLHVEIVEVRESVTLVHTPLLLIDDLRVSCIDD